MNGYNRIKSMLLRFDRMSDEQLVRLTPRQIDGYRQALISNFEASLAAARLPSGWPRRWGSLPTIDQKLKTPSRSSQRA